MRKYLIILVLFVIAGCSLQGSAPPEKLEWYTIKSPTGKCYEYANWKNGYSGYTISGQINEKYCDKEK